MTNSQTNKTAEEVLSKHTGMTFDEDTYLIQTHFEYVIKAMQEYATQQTQSLTSQLKTGSSQYDDLVCRYSELEGQLKEAREEIERLNTMADQLITNEVHFGAEIEVLTDKIQSQSKEIEELKKIIDRKRTKLDVYGKASVDDKQRIKELEEGNRITINRLNIMKEWLNPVPYSDVEACLNSIEHAIKAIDLLSGQVDKEERGDKVTQEPHYMKPCGNGQCVWNVSKTCKSVEAGSNCPCYQS